MAELIVKLALNPGNYEGGCVRVTINAEATQEDGTIIEERVYDTVEVIVSK